MSSSVTLPAGGPAGRPDARCAGSLGPTLHGGPVVLRLVRATHRYYPHMPIGKLWIYRLLFVFFVRLRISPPRITLAASNFARQFIAVQGRESPIFVNFAPPGAQNWTNRPAHGPHPKRLQRLPFGSRTHACAVREITRRVDVGSACVDIRPSAKTDVFIIIFRPTGTSFPGG